MDSAFEKSKVYRGEFEGPSKPFDHFYENELPKNKMDYKSQIEAEKENSTKKEKIGPRDIEEMGSK